MTGIRATMTIQCDGPTCRTIKEFSVEGNFKDEDAVDAKDEGWFFSGVQDLCPSCLVVQQRMINKSKYNYIKFAPEEEVKKFLKSDDNLIKGASQ